MQGQEGVAPFGWRYKARKYHWTNGVIAASGPQRPHGITFGYAAVRTTRFALGTFFSTSFIVLAYP